MSSYLKQGMLAAIRQPFLLVTLFLYRFAWGFFLYKICQSVVLPLLYRFPGNDVSETQVRLFLAEGQFVLMKTDISRSYLWLLLGIVIAKMVLTPILNAGILFSFANTQFNSGYRFFRGIVELSGTYALYYAAQMVLTLAPLWWIWPKVQAVFLKGGPYETIIRGALPYAGLMLGYGFLLHLLFLYLQFGKAWANPILRTLGTASRSLPAILGIAVVITAITVLLSLAVLGAVLLWAGFWALALYQAYRLVQTLLSLWGIASQHQLYKTKTVLI